ncbi:hypothetical protein ACJX0J_034362, partial [Zea mays]
AVVHAVASSWRLGAALSGYPRDSWTPSPPARPEETVNIYRFVTCKSVEEDNLEHTKTKM